MHFLTLKKGFQLHVRFVFCFYYLLFHQYDNDLGTVLQSNLTAAAFSANSSTHLIVCVWVSHQLSTQAVLNSLCFTPTFLTKCVFLKNMMIFFLKSLS